MLDLFRNPKTYAYEGTKAANQPRIVVIRMKPRNVYANHGTKIEIIGVNEMDPVNGMMKIGIVSNEGQVIYSQVTEVTMASGIRRLYQESVSTDALDGSYKVKVEITDSSGEE